MVKAWRMGCHPQRKRAAQVPGTRSGPLLLKCYWENRFPTITKVQGSGHLHLHRDMAKVMPNNLREWHCFLVYEITDSNIYREQQVSKMRMNKKIIYCPKENRLSLIFLITCSPLFCSFAHLLFDSHRNKKVFPFYGKNNGTSSCHLSTQWNKRACWGLQQSGAYMPPLKEASTTQL